MFLSRFTEKPDWQKCYSNPKNKWIQLTHRIWQVFEHNQQLFNIWRFRCCFSIENYANLISGFANLLPFCDCIADSIILLFHHFWWIKIYFQDNLFLSLQFQLTPSNNQGCKNKMRIFPFNFSIYYYYFYYFFFVHMRFKHYLILLTEWIYFHFLQQKMGSSFD